MSDKQIIFIFVLFIIYVLIFCVLDNLVPQFPKSSYSCNSRSKDS